jgi:transposase-like protein
LIVLSRKAATSDLRRRSRIAGYAPTPFVDLLAAFGAAMQPKPTRPLSAEQKRLRQYEAQRRHLSKVLLAEQNRLVQVSCAELRSLSRSLISKIKKQNLFKWKHYQPDIILLTVRWYLRYNLSFRNLVEMMEERGLSMDQTTIMRCVHAELDERVRRHLKPTNDSWRVDETYIKVKGQWMYLYRAVDSEGNTIDFYFSKTRDKRAAKCFFKKALRSFHVSKPRVITVDKNPAYPIAVEELRKEKNMPSGMQLRQKKYLNNIVEQDHRFIKKRVRSMLGLKSFRTATYILSGIEAMHMIKKKQVHQGVKYV